MWNEIALEELDEKTYKNTKFCFNQRTKWKYEQKEQIFVESMAGLGFGERIWCWQNFQTSFVLLIPNCTRHRMITYTNIPLVLYFMNDSTQVSGQSRMQYYTSKSRMQY
jgi:hypothetical protein